MRVSQNKKKIHGSHFEGSVKKFRNKVRDRRHLRERYHITHVNHMHADIVLRNGGTKLSPRAPRSAVKSLRFVSGASVQL